MKKIVIVYIRFSIINYGFKQYFGQSNKECNEEYVEYILNKERLSTRCKIFFDYLVPSMILASKDHQDLEIHLMVHAGDLLPQNIKNRLLELKSLYSLLELKFIKPEEDYRSNSEIISYLKTLKNLSVFAVARLDDDDMLNSNYFTLLKKYIDERYIGCSFSPPRGFRGLFLDGNFICFSAEYRDKMSQGLAHINGFDGHTFKSPHILPPGSHPRTDMIAPVILDASQICYIRSYHNNNDCMELAQVCQGAFKTLSDNKEVIECFPALKNKIVKSSCMESLLSIKPKTIEKPKQPISKGVAQKKPIPVICLASAKDRIHSHLAYKLGSAMILNSKSLLGYIRMPYVLSYIKEAHKKEIADYEARVAKNPSLKLPKLESYVDYKEALKEKQCFTYKLGEALIKANSVRGGGRIFAYLAFFQEVRRLNRELEEKRK